MPFLERPVIKQVLNLGVLVVLLLVFRVFEVVVLIDLARVRSVTCVEEVDDLLPLESGGDGTERSTETSVVMLSFRLSLLQECPHSS
jgi:hypothetical protein